MRACVRAPSRVVFLRKLPDVGYGWQSNPDNDARARARYELAALQCSVVHERLDDSCTDLTWN